jgi:hypothetical protein
VKHYAIHLDPVKGPLADPNPDCPNAAEHTPVPVLVLHGAEWAERMLRTHDQRLCEGCGLYAIWRPRRRRRTGQLPSERRP